MPTEARILKPADYQSMPWKNGKGTTTQITIFPADAGLDGTPFIWRLSIADVPDSGAFSRFPGYDRTIMVIEGEGMTLSVGGGETRRMNHLYEPFSFSGDADTQCQLLGGPIRDFNIIVDRARARYTATVVRSGGQGIEHPITGDCVLVHCLEGPMVVRLLSSGRRFDLTAGDTVEIDREMAGNPHDDLLITAPEH
ncbi:MAG: HutD family protein, partial [Alphaproteobacteria bacterium]